MTASVRFLVVALVAALAVLAGLSVAEADAPNPTASDRPPSPADSSSVAASAALAAAAERRAPQPNPSATGPGAQAGTAPSASSAPSRIQLPESTPRPEGRDNLVVRVDVQGGITQVSDEIISEALQAAVKGRAQALLLVLDTPGGLLDATRAIVQRELSAPLPVLVYVAPAGARAGSAGLFVTLASHVAAMHPTSNIGAAHPVAAFGKDIEGEMGNKVVSDTAAWARSLAEARQRNAAWAERAVRASESLTASEALAQRVVDALARDVSQLLQQVDGRVVEVAERPWKISTAGARVVVHEPRLAQRLFGWLSNPALVYLLLLFGVLGVYIEFQHPGLIVPGALGACALGIVFGVQVLPLNSFGLLLIGLAAVLFFAEVYVTSFGLLGAAGVVCLVIGSYLLFDVPGSSFRLSGWTIWSIALTLSTILLLIGYKLVQIKRQGATSGAEELIGQWAEVIEPIEPSQPGKVFFDGSLWTATASARLARGQHCRVVRRAGLAVHVEPASNESSAKL